MTFMILGGREMRHEIHPCPSASTRSWTGHAGWPEGGSTVIGVLMTLLV